MTYVQWKKECYILTWILASLIHSCYFFLKQDIRTLSSIWVVYRAERSRALRKSNSFISVPQTLPSYYCQKPRTGKWFGQRPSVIMATAGKVKCFIIIFIFQMPSSLNGWSNMDTGWWGWLWSVCRQRKETKETSLLM